MAAELNNEEGKELTSFFEGGSAHNVDGGFTPPDPETTQFYCDALNDENINMVLNNVKPELIVLLGFADYGKSTFVGSLYSYLLSKGNVEGYELYDSDTYSGFERRYYLRNVDNDDTVKSKTLRTEEDDDYLLTLTFYNPSLKEKKQLIISDRAGETYRKYVDAKERIQKDTSLPRAQKVIILLDTTRLKDDWDELRGWFIQLFSGLKENGKMPKDAEYTLLFNKIDLVNNNKDLKKAYDANKVEVKTFFRTELGVETLETEEIDSKHIHNNKKFEELVGKLLKKDETAKNEEAKLKKVLDWVNEKLK